MVTAEGWKRDLRERIRLIPAVVVIRRLRTRFRLLPMVFHPVMAPRHLRSRQAMRRGGVKLHLGCGRQHKPGFVNVDMIVTRAIDYRGSVDNLPCAPGSVQAIESYHVVEHIPHPKVPALLAYWYELLQPGGSMVVECPDVDEAMRQYLTGDDRMLASIYGHQQHPGDYHFYGYNVERLGRMLKEIGFSQVASAEPQDYHAALEPCMRIEAVK